MRWLRGRTNKDSVCPHFSSFLILISYLSLGINMHKMSCDLYFSLQNIDWNCLHSRFLSDTTSKCLARCDRSPNITWDCGSKKRNVFASITKDSFGNFSNTILGDVGEPETLKNDLNRGGWGRIQLLQETISISLQSLKVIEWDWLLSRKFRPQNFQFRPNAKDFQEK